MGTVGGPWRWPREGCNFVVVHEQFYFYPFWDKLQPQHLTWRANRRRIETAERNGLSVMRLHGTMDLLHNFEDFAELIGLKLEKRGGGLYRVFPIAETTVGELVARLKRVLKLERVRMVGDLNRRVRCVGLPMGGLCLDWNIPYMQVCIDLGADVLIGGEADKLRLPLRRRRRHPLHRDRPLRQRDPGVLNFAKRIGKDFPASRRSGMMIGGRLNTDERLKFRGQSSGTERGRNATMGISAGDGSYVSSLRRAGQQPGPEYCAGEGMRVCAAAKLSSHDERRHGCQGPDRRPADPAPRPADVVRVPRGGVDVPAGVQPARGPGNGATDTRGGNPVPRRLSAGGGMLPRLGGRSRERRRPDLSPRRPLFQMDAGRPGEVRRPQERGQGLGASHPVRRLETRGRYVGIAFGGTGLTCSDELYVFKGGQRSQGREVRAGTGRRFLRHAPAGVFHEAGDHRDEQGRHAHPRRPARRERREAHGDAPR